MFPSHSSIRRERILKKVDVFISLVVQHVRVGCIPGNCIPNGKSIRYPNLRTTLHNSIKLAATIFDVAGPDGVKKIMSSEDC